MKTWEIRVRLPSLAMTGPYSIGSDCWPGLAKLIEECGEVTQVAGKLIAISGNHFHYDGSDLRSRIAEEIGDLIAAAMFVCEKNGIDVAQRIRDKLETFERWHMEHGS